MIYQLKNKDNFDNVPKTIQHNPRDLPPALAPLLALDHWVVWRWEPNAQGKWTKPPYQARSSAGNASVNDPGTWADYGAACEAVEAGKAAGIGFVLTDTPFAAFDLDDCVIDRETGEVSPWALKLIEKTGSYAEVTPSGTGLRIIGTALGDPIHRKFKVEAGSLEVYREATRFITITGAQFDAEFGTLINIDEAIDETVSLLCGPRETGSPRKPRKGNGTAPDGTSPVDLGELIRNGAPIGERSQRFFYVVATLKDRGFSVDEIESLIANTGIAEKYRDRLRSEIERCFDKAKPNGARCGEDTKIEQLASLSPAEYEKTRKETAKELGVRVRALDALVKAARPKDGVDIVSDAEPWPDAVDGVTLLGEIETTIKRFLVCGVFTPRTLSLWIAATWLADAFHVAPILNIVSPELRCGKTTCLDIVSRLVRRSMTTSNISPPAMFRSIEKFKPTLIIDEADAFFSENEDLRGIINSGHTRPTAYVIRTVGDDHEPKKFTTWAFKAIAGIGKRAATIEDRSIGVALKRKLPDEQVERLRYAKAELFETLARKLARWTMDNAVAVAAARPDLPESLNDRQQDNWEPLLAIAAVAGGSWPKRARMAATAASEAPAEESPQMQLLIDIRDVFEEKGCEEIFSEALVTALLAMQDRPWGECNKGKALTQNKLARMLKPYGVATKTLRNGDTKAKGYERKDFADAFNRYLPLHNRGTVHTE